MKKQKTQAKSQKKSPMIVVGIVLVVLGLGAISLVKRSDRIGMFKDGLQNEAGFFKNGVKNETGSNFDFADVWRDRKGSYHCSYQYGEEMASYKMDYYFADKQLAIFINSADHKMNTIVMEDYTYTWTSDSAQGYKMPTDNEAWDEETEEMEADFSEYNENVDDFNASNFKCEAWRKDNKVFTLPADIEFIEMGAYPQMEDYAAQMEDYQMME